MPTAGEPGPESPGPDLPPAATVRLTEMRETRTWGSTLSVDEFAAISRVGFEPAGQVLGAAVYNLGDAGDDECPYGLAVFRGEGTPAYRAPGSVPRLTGVVPVGAAAIGTARPLVATLYQARRAAITRMTQECAALGALGVIGVQLTVGAFGDDEDILEFRAFGTAVRARGVTSRARPFASDLSGQDFTKLVAHGWVPVGLAMGVAVGYRHDDWLTRGQTRFTVGNVEVDGYSYLVRQMRTDARNELQLDLVRMGAEGVVVREMETHVSERRCPLVPFGKDHIVQATIVGTAIAQFARIAPPPIYGVRTLNDHRSVPSPVQQLSVNLGGTAEAGGDRDVVPGAPEPGTEPAT